VPDLVKLHNINPIYAIYRKIRLGDGDLKEYFVWSNRPRNDRIGGLCGGPFYREGTLAPRHVHHVGLTNSEH